MKLLQLIKFVFVLFILSALASCGSSGGDSVSSSSSSGRVSLLITDAPTTDFDQVNITLESISFLAEDDNNDEQETVLFEETQVINLLALQNYSDLLSTVTIPAGSYSKIRLRVSRVELVRLDAEGQVVFSEDAKLPANGKIDLNPQDSFEVVGGGHLIIELDMDAEKSIHIVETGNGKFIFRPVIFVNILGEEELKLVILDGKVLEKTEVGFQLCDVDVLVVNDSCFNIEVSGNTVVQDDLIDALAAADIKDNDIVTVLGKAGSLSVKALHVVIAAAEGEEQNLALFTGKATSPVAVDGSFSMETDDDNNIVAPGTALAVTLATSARLFDKYGAEVTNDNIKDGSDLDVFGLAIPDLVTVTDVKAAFAIVNNDVQADKVSGTITAINALESEITVTGVTESFSGDICVDVAAADMFLLGTTVEGDITSDEIGINDLNTGMSVDVYGQDDGSGCIAANVVLASEN